MPFSPLSLRATEWRGNPAGNFGIPNYDPDWIAASAFQAFLAMTDWVASQASPGKGHPAPYRSFLNASTVKPASFTIPPIV